jgi:hypothetical protein
MKQNGSIYVVLVIVAVAGYFTYQWWFNPSRAIKRQLGELAATLSAPEAEADIARVARFAQLRRFFADTVHARQGASEPEIASRDQLLAVVANWSAPRLGRDVQFVDVQIAVDSDVAAHAFLTVEVTTPDERSRQPVVADSRDAAVRMALQNGAWVITSAEPYEPPARQ